MYLIDVYGLSPRHDLEQEAIRYHLERYFLCDIGTCTGRSIIAYYNNPCLRVPEDELVTVHITTSFYDVHGAARMHAICTQVAKIVRERVHMHTVCFALPEKLDYVRSRFY